MTETLDKLREKLSECDAIVELDAMKRVREFVAENGPPGELIDALSSNYRGLAAMCNLVADWLDLSGMSPQLLCSLCDQFMERQVIERFDARKADALFASASHRAPPQWLNEMLGSARWRRLLCTLAKRNRDCLLLDFAIQRICDAGHSGELILHPSAANYLSVYEPVLIESLSQFAQLDHASHYYQLLPSFFSLCLRSDLAYVFARSVLAHLAQRDERFARLADDLDERMKMHGFAEQRSDATLSSTTNQSSSAAAAAATSIGNVASSGGDRVDSAALATLFPLMLSGSHARHSHFSMALVSLIDAHTDASVQLARIDEIYAYYAQNRDNNDDDSDDDDDARNERPPIALVQCPAVLDAIIGVLFQHFVDRTVASLSISTEQVRRALYLLARASTSDDDDDDDDEAMHKTLATLQSVYDVCQRHSSAIETPETASLLRLRRAIRDEPMAAACVLRWVAVSLTDEHFYRASHFTGMWPMLLKLLRDIVRCHEPHRDRVCRLLAAAFDIRPDLDALAVVQLKKNLLDVLIFLMKLGYVTPVLELVERWNATLSADQSLIRYALFRMLSMARAPYSPLFCGVILRIVARAHTLQGIRIAIFRERKHRQLLVAFLQHCSSTPSLERRLGPLERRCLTALLKLDFVANSK
jgi:TH1 protein